MSWYVGGSMPLPSAEVVARTVPAAAQPQAAPAAGGMSPAAAAAQPSLGQQLLNGFAGLASFAQRKMDEVQSALSQLMQNGKTPDGGQIAVLNNQMSKFNLLNEQAAKMQQKQEESARAWIR